MVEAYKENEEDNDNKKLQPEEKDEEMQKENDRSSVEEEEEQQAEKRGENHDKDEEEEEDDEEDGEDAKAHHHVEPESAEQPVTKRDRTLKNTSDEVEPPKKVNKLSVLCPETGTGLGLVDSDAVTATLFGEPRPQAT